VLALDMTEILPPMGKYKYDTWRILLVKCYIDNFVRLRSCIRNVNIYRLNKSLYGLNQAPQVWYNRFASYLLSLGFVEAILPSSFLSMF
jgi:hypothetical protein